MRYKCLSCRFRTDVRVDIKDHAAILGHFGWTDSEHPQALCSLCGPGYRIGDEGCRHTGALDADAVDPYLDLDT